MYNLLQHRRSIRKYTPQLVNEDVVNRLIKSILRSPSGNNINPWEIVYLDDDTLISQLAQSKAHGAKFLEGAHQCLVLLADPNKTDVWIEDASIALTIGHLAATNLGLGSCWIQIRNRKTADDLDSETYVKELLHIPESLRVIGLLPFGYPDESKEGHAEDKLQLEKVYKNRYSKQYF